MKDARSWVQKKLSEKGYSSRRLPPCQLEIERDKYPPARILCIGLDSGETLDAPAVDDLLAQVPEVGFIVVLPTRIGHSAYERADERGICVAGFGELQDALEGDEDIARHIDSQEQYERKRLVNSRWVESIKRRGHHAYTIERRELRPLTIVTTNEYEFTVDELYTLLDEYAGIEPDLIVVTNPNCHGLSSESVEASERSGVPIALFNDFLGDLGVEWK